MPEFSTPFAVKHSERQLTQSELVRAIRFNIAAEYEAIQLYEQLAESTDDIKAKRILYEIAEDERVHAGNFLELLKILHPGEANSYTQGKDEVNELLEK